MFEYEIFHEGKAIGTLTAERAGLYWRVRARCRFPGNTILRLYAIGPDRTQRLGVPMPEGEELVLQTRVAASTFDFTPDTVVSTADQAQWTPWSGEVFGVPVDRALRRGGTVAIPHSPGEEFPVMAHFGRFVLGQIGEGVYWMTELEENPAQPEKTVDIEAKCDRISEN